MPPPVPFVGAGGGGGGAACLLCSCCCPCSSFSQVTMKSWFSRMKSSVRPFDFKSSPKCSLQYGSKASSKANSDTALGGL